MMRASRKGSETKNGAEQISENLNVVQVQFLPPWCQGEADSPAVRLILNLAKRESKAASCSLIDHPAEHG